jgi:AraC-like DNA-binding protein
MAGTTLYDLRRDPRFLMDKPFHSVHFYFPRKLLNAIADAANAPHIDALCYEPGNGVDDPIVRALTSVLHPALDRPDQANNLFIDYVMLALGCHITQTYGGLAKAACPPHGGLAPWQERRAKEIIEANLDGEVRLAQLVQECDLSAGHFSRAFKDTMGIPPTSVGVTSAHRERQATFAESTAIAAGGGSGLRLFRSESFHACIHEAFWNQSPESGDASSRNKPRIWKSAPGPACVERASYRERSQRDAGFAITERRSAQSRLLTAQKRSEACCRR